MPGEVTTGTLSQAMPIIIAKAKVIREYEGVWQRTCQIERQKAGTGLNWIEYQINQLSSQHISETVDNRNYQLISGTLLQAEPTMAQIVMKISDRTFRKLQSVVTSQWASLPGNAMKRLKDEDYLALFSGFATTCSPRTGNPLSHGHIAAAANNCKSNTTEPSNTEVFSVLHGFQIYDLQTELTAGVGTYTVPEGMTEEIFRKGFEGTVSGSNVFVDGNITVDSTPDANGATHAREGVYAVLSMEIKKEEDRDMYFGGGADVLSMVDEYVFLERTSAGTQTFAYRHLSDATAPAS